MKELKRIRTILGRAYRQMRFFLRYGTLKPIPGPGVYGDGEDVPSHIHALCARREKRILGRW